MLCLLIANGNKFPLLVCSTCVGVLLQQAPSEVEAFATSIALLLFTLMILQYPLPRSLTLKC